jgi:hypothetical protein
MFKYMKKFNWEKLVDVAVFIIATAVGILIFTTAFVFAKAIIEAVF